MVPIWKLKELRTHLIVINIQHKGLSDTKWIIVKMGFISTSLLLKQHHHESAIFFLCISVQSYTKLAICCCIPAFLVAISWLGSCVDSVWFINCNLNSSYLAQLSRKWSSSSITLQTLHFLSSRGVLVYLPLSICKSCALMRSLHNTCLCFWMVIFVK